MHPIKLTIRGEFWDSQIYRGKLLLFALDGSLRTIDWDAAIAAWGVSEDAKLALVTAFMRSDFLYGPEFVVFFRDPEIRSLLERKFGSLAESELTLSDPMLARHELPRQENRFSFPHSDSEIYKQNLFVASSNGIQRATCGQGTEHHVSSLIHRTFDGPVFAIAAAYDTVAAAAGDDGLFQVAAFRNSVLDGDGLRQMSGVRCEDCHWVFQSIFASSVVGEGAFVEYNRPHDLSPESQFSLDRPSERRLIGVQSSTKLFGRSGYSWGLQDKLCVASNGAIRVLKYTPWAGEQADRMRAVGEVATQRSGAHIVSANNAPFGMIVEYDDALVVYPSVGAPIVVKGEPVSWRVFPRSKHYENQLHVVYEDRLEILSFNHDYFVSQEHKVSGIEVRRPRLVVERLRRAFG